VVAAITTSIPANSAKIWYEGRFGSWKSCCCIVELSALGDGSAGGVVG